MKRPINEVVNGVFRILEENHLNLPQQSVEYVVSAMTEWLESTKRGHEMMAYLLQLEHIKGQSDKEYWRVDGFGRLTEKIKPESIVFLRGAVLNGETLSLKELQISDKEYVHCEGCGAKTVCSEPLTSQDYQGMWACSYCKSMSGDASVISEIDLNCKDCTFTTCAHHPKHYEHEMEVS